MHPAYRIQKTGRPREAQAAASRPHFLNLMGTEWLPAILDGHARLQYDPPWRGADIGSGLGVD